MRGNGERHPDEIQAEIAHTRHEMDATLHALEKRLTPGELFDQGLEYFRSSGANEFVSNLTDQVKANPMPVAVAGVALAWLAASSRSGRASAGSGRMMGAAREATGRAKEKVSEMSGKVSEVSGKVSEMADKAKHMSATAMQQAQRARGTLETMMREQPLALGAIGLAVGAVLAASIPETREEHRLMGGARDSLAEKAKQAGKEKLEQAKDTVAETAKDLGGKVEQKMPSHGSRQG